ncbi:MAG TPA: YifB family Mg chelatase-like AAA ATPase, partial [Stackebrandtia sp.]|uniref:YifB family Mg chelatase-like AAA ATPase n=1 Tax=Stackebrandtia sp. TaxID=2023065 RepID=UPI002D2F4BAE
MPYCHSTSVCLSGLRGDRVTVEAHVGNGLPCVALTGLADTALQQAKVRVRSAVENTGIRWPDGRVVLNLLPASLPKSGSACDVAIAAALLAAVELVPARRLRGLVLLGELGLDGQVRPVRGVLPALMAGRDHGLSEAVVPADNLGEAAVVTGMRTHGARSLSEVLAFLRGEVELERAEPAPAPPAPVDLPDMADVIGQEAARRAIEVAAAGGHHVFMVGPPGAGKTMLAERLPSILPPLGDAAALETTALHSIAGMLPTGSSVLLRHPPFSAPHHSATMPAMVGGGTYPLRPGAVSLAHNGVLFLDECPEARREVLDSLRQPLERGEVLISRSRSTARFPARVQLVLAANPCPCGVGGHGACTCTPMQRRRYLGRLSGPLLDRVDIRLEMAPVSAWALLSDDAAPEASGAIAARVRRARDAATERWSAAGTPWRTNSEA